MSHDHTPDDDGYNWPVCSAGPETGPRSHKLWMDELDRQICRPCEDRTRARLAELDSLFRKIDTTAALMRGARRSGGGGTGSKTPPIPPRLEVLSLVGPGGVASRLSAIEDSWRSVLGWTVAPWRGSPAQAVPHLVTFLINNLPWAADSYESIGQDVEELRRLHAEMKQAADHEHRPGRVKIGLCPVPRETGPCGTQLTARADSHRVHCSGCDSRWETLGEWRELRAAQERVAVETAGVAA
ncbi:hypothetical protein [Streptomyces sp. NPDC058108]|uniref:hypothetical protein n=1 Tax=Streptomyces sp. NPDC058108 TaxID=3346344 RepID=UPI0036E92A5B